MEFDFSNFLPTNNLIMACLITGVHDVNRNMTLDENNYELAQNWAESIIVADLHGIIFHNTFTKETCERYASENILFVEVAYDPQYNPNVYRYFVYKNFLQQHIHRLKNIFITDISDVSLVKNPFIDPYFIENPSAIFCGDEPKTLDNDWMRAHSVHLRKNLSDYVEYESKFGNETLLNCGVIGGNVAVMDNFLQKLCAIHQHANSENSTRSTGDMGAFNYLARTQFNSQMRHGEPVNTVFKMFENERKDCWFRHK